MLVLMRKYAAWRIVEFFLRNPSASVYVKELAASLSMSSYTTSRVLAQLREEGILDCETCARAKFYSLADNPTVRALKRLRIIADIEQAGLVKNILSVDEDAISIALYGSYATGEYDEKSDMDIVCLSDVREEEFADCVRKLERALGLELSLRVLPVRLWKEMARKDPVFYDNVVRSMVLLHGTSLVVR
ncbi:MAG: nucleotidyltransferase domain-containing protein [Candidatus Thermoplasmatota archaeon]